MAAVMKNGDAILILLKHVEDILDGSIVSLHHFAQPSLPRFLSRSSGRMPPGSMGRLRKYAPPSTRSCPEVSGKKMTGF